VYALDHHVERLATDHAHARLLAEALAELPAVELDPGTVETNIVICRVPDATALATALQRHDVLVGTLDSKRLRMVTHLDVDRAGVEHAIDAFRAAL
jgi:threonine aldolase